MRRVVIILLFSTLYHWCYAQTNPIDSLLKNLKDEKIDSNVYNAYIKIAGYYKDSAYDKTLYYYNKALDIVERTNQRKKVADVYHNIGWMYMIKGELPNALQNYNNALSILEFIKDNEEVGGVLNDIGLVYKTWGKYEKAIDYFLRALKVFEERGNPEFIAVISNNIGQVYYYREDYENAIIYFKKYLDFNKSVKKSRAIAGAANNIASALMEQQKFDDALNYFIISMRIYDSLNIKVGVAVIKDNIGSLYLRKKQYNDALKFSTEASKIFEELGSQSRLCASLQSVGLAYSKLNNKESALKFLNRSLDLAIKLNLRETKKSVYETLAEVYSQNKDYENALKNYKLYTEIKDSLMNAETVGKIESIQAEYESKRKEKELAEITKKFQNQKMLGLIAVGVIIIFLFLTSLIIRENQIKKSNIKKSSDQLSAIYKVMGKFNNNPILDTTHIVDSFFNKHWFVKSIENEHQSFIPFYKEPNLYFALLSKGWIAENEGLINPAILDFFNSSFNEKHEMSIKEQFLYFISNDETWSVFKFDKQIFNVDFWYFNTITKHHLYSGNISAFHINERNQIADLSKSANTLSELKTGDRLFFSTSNSLHSFILNDQNSIQNSISKTIEKSINLNFEQQKEILENNVELIEAGDGQNARISIFAIQV